MTSGDGDRIATTTMITIATTIIGETVTTEPHTTMATRMAFATVAQTGTGGCGTTGITTATTSRHMSRGTARVTTLRRAIVVRYLAVVVAMLPAPASAGDSRTGSAMGRMIARLANRSVQ